MSTQPSKAPKTSTPHLEHTYVQKRAIDIYAIVSMIIAVIVIIFLSISVAYFWKISKANIISTAVGSTMFWTGIVMLVMLFIVVVYAMIRIFTFKKCVIPTNAEIAQNIAVYTSPEFRKTKEYAKLKAEEKQREIKRSLDTLAINQ